MPDAPEPIDTPNSTTEAPAAATTVAPPEVASSTTETPTPDAPAADADEGSILTGKPEGEAPKEGDDAEPSPLFGAPAEDAAYELTGLPEGVTIDGDALAAIAPVARELNLSNEGLSKIAGVYAEKVLPHVQTTLAQQINDDAAQLRKDWATDTRALIAGGKNAAGEDVAADTVFQGKALADVQKTAARALDRFGGDGFREFLDTHGLGNHPQVVRFAYQAGALLGEDTDLPRGGDVAKPKTREEKYYNASS